MINERERLEQAKSRLAQKAPPRHRPQTIIGLVRDLEPEIMQARARGKLWSDIARDLSGDEAIRPDSVRLAFSRLRSQAVPVSTKVKSQSRPAKSKQGIASSPVSAVTAPTSPAGAGLFAPMFDAQDTIGRNRGEKL